MFPVFKDEHTDRIAFSRIPRDSVEFHLPGYARYTIGGHDLLELHVPAGHQVKVWTDDLVDCYPSFRASVDRGRTNSFSFTASLDAFAGTRAHRQFVTRCTREKISLPRRVRPCHQGLPMGDLNAADWAAEAHSRLLRQHGSLQRRHCFQNGSPAPKGGHVEALVLDDHVGVAIDSIGPVPGQPQNEDAEAESCARAGHAYAASGWTPSVPQSTARGARRRLLGS